MDSNEAIARLERCYCVHFVSLEEIGESELRLVVAANEGPDLFEFVWSSHFSYAARSEHFCQMDQAEKWTGDIYRIFSSSKFLDFIRAATFATAQLPGPFHHYQVQSLYRIVDVAALKPPVIRVSARA